MMRMLEAGGLAVLSDGLRRADADNPRGYLEFEPVKRTRTDTSWLPLAEGKAVKVVHVLLRNLPQGYRYRVIWMHRRIEEVIASQNAMLARRGATRSSLPDGRLASVFLRQLEEVRQSIDRQPNFRRLDVDFNELVADPRPSVERVSTFCGGLAVEEMLAVVEPGLYRQRVAPN
jgi:hypothetical protein